MNNKIIIQKIIRFYKKTLILIFLSWTTYSFVFEPQKKIRKIVLTTSIPMLTEKGFVDLIDSVSVIYKNDILLYELMPTYYYNFNENDSLENKHTKYKYFILKKGDKRGYIFDSLNAINSRKIDTDSILKKTGFLDPTFFNKNDCSLIKTIKNKDGFAKIETYATKKYSDNDCDTMQVYYTNKIKNIEYTLSKHLDSVSKLKVCMIKMKFNSRFVKDAKRVFPASEVTLSIKEELSNLKRYESFINHFNTNHKTNR